MLVFSVARLNTVIFIIFSCSIAFFVESARAVDWGKLKKGCLPTEDRMKRDSSSPCHCPPQRFCPKNDVEWLTTPRMPPQMVKACCNKPKSNPEPLMMVAPESSSPSIKEVKGEVEETKICEKAERHYKICSWNENKVDYISQRYCTKYSSNKGASELVIENVDMINTCIEKCLANPPRLISEQRRKYVIIEWCSRDCARKVHFQVKWSGNRTASGKRTNQLDCEKGHVPPTRYCNNYSYWVHPEISCEKKYILNECLQHTTEQCRSFFKTPNEDNVAF